MTKAVTKHPKPSLRRDKEWRSIESELSLVQDFIPLGSVVEDGIAKNQDKSTTYASISVSSKNIDGKITGYIMHKEDFLNLWLVFKDRRIDRKKEEVLIYWSTKHYTSKVTQLFSITMPKILVMVCPKGTYKESVEGRRWLRKEKPKVLVESLNALSWWIPGVFNKWGRKIIDLKER